MALQLGSMIQAARTQQNPAGDAIANFQNQVDRGHAEEQRLFNNGMRIANFIMQLKGLGGAGGLGGGAGGAGGMTGGAGM